jgi:hypothetical protein
MDILDTYQGLMKMVESMENKSLLHPRVKLEVRSPRSIMLAKVMEANAKKMQVGLRLSWGLMMTKRRCLINNRW